MMISSATRLADAVTALEDGRPLSHEQDLFLHPDQFGWAALAAKYGSRGQIQERCCCVLAYSDSPPVA